MKTYDIYVYMRNKYPDASYSIREGSLNCFIRAYAKEVGYFDVYDDIGVDLFFKVLSDKTDDELLSIRNMGINKVRFLRKAYDDYAQKFKSNFKTKFNTIIDDWTRVKNHCRTTDNKDFTEKEPTDEFKRKLLISEHSPIRLIEIDWSWEDIYSWVATHWSRHKFEKFISTQRDDRKEHDIPRGEMPQNTPVKFDGYANMQNLIDSFRKRLCYQASPETRELAEDFKKALTESKPELGYVLVPNCVYRCGCPEFKTCGLFNKIVKSIRSGVDDDTSAIMDLTDINVRYEVYNERFEEKWESEG